MTIGVIAVEIVAGLGIIVHFSDQTLAVYPTEELTFLRPFREAAPPQQAN